MSAVLYAVDPALFFLLRSFDVLAPVLRMILELAGTAAFAVSGAMIGLKKRMDLFGVCMMGVTTACGGGLLRDLFLGMRPPVLFRDPAYALLAIGVSLLVFLASRLRLLHSEAPAFETVLLLADSLGLGVFTAAGVAAAMQAGFGENVCYCVFLSTLTGVGGGTLRDVLAGQPPYIFVKHIYACACIAGGILCTLLWNPLGQGASMVLCFILVSSIRLLAAKYRWSLPKADPQYI